MWDDSHEDYFVPSEYEQDTAAVADAAASSHKKHESLWSLNSACGDKENVESPRQKRANTALIISIVLFLCVAVAAAIAIPICVVFGANRHKSCSKAAGKDGFKPCMEYLKSDGTKAGGEHSPPPSPPQVPEKYRHTSLDPETWIDKAGFNLTFTDVKVGGLPVMGLNTSYSKVAAAWDYSEQPMKGVNIGGWLVLEPFITPSKFGGNAVDEWTYCESLADSIGADDVKRDMEQHYATFVTEQDFQDIAEAGLDHVRIPFGYWLVDGAASTPYVPFIGWRYLLRGIEWARKYNLRVFLDLHAVPGSQNGWNHSGRMADEPEWLNASSAKGAEYGAQTLEIHKRLAAFFSQERYRNLVMFYGLVNEPLTVQLGPQRVVEWHQAAYKVVSDAGFPSYIVMGDGLMGPHFYNQGQFNSVDYPKMVLDIHQYMVFDKYLLGLPHGAKNAFVCHEWEQMLNHTSMPRIVGEWSAAVNDCGTYVNNVGAGTRWEGNFTAPRESDSVLEPVCAGGDCRCAGVSNATFSDPVYRQFLRAFASNQMGVYQNLSWGWMFWTWKTEDNPQWSLKTLLHEQIVRLSDMPARDDTTDWGVLGLSESI